MGGSPRRFTAPSSGWFGKRTSFSFPTSRERGAPCRATVRRERREPGPLARTRLLGPLRADRFALALRLRGERGALRRVQLDLAQADRLRRHLDALVVADELQRLLERKG